MTNNNNKQQKGPCPACESTLTKYHFTIDSIQYSRCEDCNFIFRESVGEKTPSKGIIPKTVYENDLEKECLAKTGRVYLKTIINYTGSSKGNMLILGAENEVLKEEAEKAGFTLSYAPDLEEGSLKEKSGFFDICIAAGIIETGPSLSGTMEKIHSLLKKNGALFITTPSLENWVQRSQKHRFKIFDSLFFSYFDSQTIENILAKTHFNKVYQTGNYQYVLLKNIKKASYLYKFTFGLGLLTFFSYLLPFLNKKKCRVRTNQINVIASTKEVRQKPLLSIVLPVFNEVNNFPKLIKLVLDKKLPGLDKEIILIESNSTDGTREEVMKYENHPEVSIYLEDKPQGKGHACRYGFEKATGDFILIQDSDLEYDIDDYDQLLVPLVNFRKGFVLGSRHSKGWKMRHFEDQKAVSTFMNLGHQVFTGMVNIFSGSKLADPFTMFKVFRTDCLYNVGFFGNRFDLDWELVVKLIRKGYMPLELPVNYTSRSFQEGKKISLIADPIICMITLVKSRFSRLFDKKFEK